MLGVAAAGAGVVGATVTRVVVGVGLGLVSGGTDVLRFGTPVVVEPGLAVVVDGAVVDDSVVIVVEVVLVGCVVSAGTDVDTWVVTEIVLTGTVVVVPLVTSLLGTVVVVPLVTSLVSAAVTAGLSSALTAELWFSEGTVTLKQTAWASRRSPEGVLRATESVGQSDG